MSSKMHGTPLVDQHDIALPPGYRSADVLAFHGRDPAGLAEQVDAGGLRKAVLLAGTPTLLEIRFGPGMAHCRVCFDGPATPALRACAHGALRRVLGLTIDPAPFAAQVRDDPWLGPIVARQPGLRIVQSATVFEALSWAIIGQQINLTFATALRRTLIQVAGRAHSSGLWCYPEAGDVARINSGELTGRKFSAAKAGTLLRVAQMVAAGSLWLEPSADVADIGADGGGAMADQQGTQHRDQQRHQQRHQQKDKQRNQQDRRPDQLLAAVSRQLLAIKGIGPWTVNYVLLRGYGYPDCSLHGDVAVRAALHQLSGSAARPTVDEAEILLARYAPQRTMAAAYLWASLAEHAAPGQARAADAAP